MAELSLMASALFSPGIFHQDHALLRPPPKDFQTLSPGHGKKQNSISSGCMQIRMHHFENPWKFSSSLPENKLYWTPAIVDEPVLIDVQDACPDSVLFSFGVAEQCTRQERILKYLTSGSNLTDGSDSGISLISDLMEFQNVATVVRSQLHVLTDDEFCHFKTGKDHFQQIIHPQEQLLPPRCLLDFVGNLSLTSFITVHPNGHVLFPGSAGEMRELLSIFTEFNMWKSLSNGSKKATVVPYFTRKRSEHARSGSQLSFSKFETRTAVPSKSAGNCKSKSLSTKKQKPTIQRLSKNYIYACDCLFNMYTDKSGERTTILSLKNSSAELTQLLSRFSAGIVGTGLAVLFSVACKSANAKLLALPSAKLFHLSFGFGLFWLSWSVNRLRDTIYNFGKRSIRAKKPKEEELVETVKRSMNEILFRFAALAAVGLLSF